MLVERINLVSGAENELRLLQNEVELMKAFLGETEKKREEGSELFKQHEKQIREAVYKAKDTIEECLTQAASESQKSRGFAIKNLTKRLDLAKKVKFIREEDIEPVFFRARMEFSNLPMADSTLTTNPNPQTSKKRLTPIAKETIVGFEEDLIDIKGRLCGEPSHLQIIPIIGMGGIGKTTLARYTYQDPSTTHHFDVRVWATVWQNSSAKIILSSLLSSMDPSNKEEYQDMDKKCLVQHVHKYLKKRRYLIVMDDMWDINVWDDVRMAFPNDCNGSRIIITTRDLNVASYVDSSNQQDAIDVRRSKLEATERESVWTRKLPSRVGEGWLAHCREMQRASPSNCGDRWSSV